MTDTGKNDTDTTSQFLRLLIKNSRKRLENKVLIRYQLDQLRINHKVPERILQLFGVDQMPEYKFKLITANKINYEDYLKINEVP